MQNKIILVGGYCATGKSVFSIKLSNLLDIPCFNKDIIKEVMGEGFGSEYDMVEKKGSAATFLLLLYIAEKTLQANKICILESNFKLYEMEKIKILLEKYNCECLTFLFQGDNKLLYERYMKRDVLEKRHWVHNTAGETKESFEKGHKKVGMGEHGIGKTIITDTTSFENVNYDELYNAAKLFINC
jgi:predicted kinase